MQRSQGSTSLPPPSLTWCVGDGMASDFYAATTQSLCLAPGWLDSPAPPLAFCCCWVLLRAMHHTPAKESVSYTMEEAQYSHVREGGNTFAKTGGVHVCVVWCSTVLFIAYPMPPPPSYHPCPQLDRVWGRGDGAMLKPKFTGIAVFVARVTAPYTRLLGVYKHSFGASEGSKGGALLVFRSFSEGYHRRLH
jgi:hypothetical protein